MALQERLRVTCLQTACKLLFSPLGLFRAVCWTPRLMYTNLSMEWIGRM